MRCTTTLKRVKQSLIVIIYYTFEVLVRQLFFRRCLSRNSLLCPRPSLGEVQYFGYVKGLKSACKSDSRWRIDARCVWGRARRSAWWILPSWLYRLCEILQGHHDRCKWCARWESWKHEYVLLASLERLMSNTKSWSEVSSNNWDNPLNLRSMEQMSRSKDIAFAESINKIV